MNAIRDQISSNCRTYPGHQDRSDDDIALDLSRYLEHLEDVVITEKLDGENTTLYHDYLHARSVDSNLILQEIGSRGFMRKFGTISLKISGFAAKTYTPNTAFSMMN